MNSPWYPRLLLPALAVLGAGWLAWHFTGQPPLAVLPSSAPPLAAVAASSPTPAPAHAAVPVAAAEPDHPEAAEAAPPLPTPPMPLFNGHDLDAWRLMETPAGNWRIADGDLVVHNPTGKDAAFHAEIGGMSWDDYEIAAEIRCDDLGTAGHFMGWNVQLSPNNTRIFAQLLMGGTGKLAYFDADRPGHEFVNLDSRPLSPAINVGEWHRLGITVSEGDVTLRVDGQDIVANRIDLGTRGMFGLLINFGSDATVRLRALTIRFLKPTADQLRECSRPAATNWAQWVAARTAAGEPLLLARPAATVSKPVDF